MTLNELAEMVAKAIRDKGGDTRVEVMTLQGELQILGNMTRTILRVGRAKGEQEVTVYIVAGENK